MQKIIELTKYKKKSPLKAKILVTDMPDLGKFHIKRSSEYPVHYIYLFHSMFSVHSYLRKGAVDNYDTIFCVGPHQIKEIREAEKVYGLKPKKLINYGYGRLDTLLEKKKDSQTTNSGVNDLIIIAPSPPSILSESEIPIWFKKLFHLILFLQGNFHSTDRMKRHPE